MNTSDLKNPLELRAGQVGIAFAVVVNSDSTEGRGGNVDLAYFWDSGEAQTYAKGKDVMGSNGKLAERRVLCSEQGNFTLYKPIDIHASQLCLERAKAREKLLSTMSFQELEILGIRL